MVKARFCMVLANALLVAAATTPSRLVPVRFQTVSARSSATHSDRTGVVPTDTGCHNKSEAMAFVLGDNGEIKRADRAAAKLLRVSDLLHWPVLSNPAPTLWPLEAYVWVVKVEGATQMIGQENGSDWLVRIFGGSKRQPLFAITSGLGVSVPGWDSLPDHDPNG